MEQNRSELQYLRLLKRIIVENVKPEYDNVAKDYLDGNISVDKAYDQLLALGQNNLHNVLGEISQDRTKTGTYKVFGETLRFDLRAGFPLLTTKEVFTRGLLEELFWFIKGETNIKALVEKRVGIWNEWPYAKYQKTKEYQAHPISMKEFVDKIKTDEAFAKQYGDLGPVYGAQWRNFGGHDHFKRAIEENLADPNFKETFDRLCTDYNLPWLGAKGVDQLTNAIDTLKNNPNDRRILVFAYNPQEVQDQALPACHAFFQLNVKNKELSLLMYQRSCDMFLGVPFNIASYAALTYMIAQVTGLKAKEFIHVLGDAHIYSNHVEQVQTQLSRTPYEMPTLWLDPEVKKLEEFDISKVIVKNYKHHSKIEAEVSV